MAQHRLRPPQTEQNNQPAQANNQKGYHRPAPYVNQLRNIQVNAHIRHKKVDYKIVKININENHQQQSATNQITIMAGRRIRIINPDMRRSRIKHIKETDARQQQIANGYQKTIHLKMVCKNRQAVYARWDFARLHHPTQQNQEKHKSSQINQLPPPRISTLQQQVVHIKQAQKENQVKGYQHIIRPDIFIILIKNQIKHPLPVLVLNQATAVHRRLVHIHQIHILVGNLQIIGKMVTQITAVVRIHILDFQQSEIVRLPILPVAHLVIRIPPVDKIHP